MRRLALSLSLALALAPDVFAQGLTLENAQPTLGVHGPKRADASYLPGDSVVWRFDIAGLAPDADGRVRFGVLVQVAAADGKPVFLDQQEIGPLGNALGGGKIRHTVQAPTGLETAPGEYVLKVTVADRGSRAGAEAKLEKRFTVKKPELALVRPQISADLFGKLPAPAAGMLGQTLCYNVVAVGFDGDRQAPSLAVELSVQDDRSQPLGKPISVEFRDLPRDTKYLPLRLDLPLTKAGAFKVQLKVTDLTTKKTATLTLPLRVIEE